MEVLLQNETVEDELLIETFLTFVTFYKPNSEK